MFMDIHDYTNMDKEIEKLFHITKCNYNEYCILDILYRVSTYSCNLSMEEWFQRPNWS